MSPRGVVKCESCNAEFEGELPDDRPVGYNYTSTLGQIDGEIDRKLANQLQNHHLDTATVHLINKSIRGHKYFNVFLEDGRQGNVEANSYCVVYKASNNKLKD